MITSILQPTHLILILAVALLVLGPKRLPEAGRSLGQGLKEFRASIGGHESVGGRESANNNERVDGDERVGADEASTAMKASGAIKAVRGHESDERS